MKQTIEALRNETELENEKNSTCIVMGFHQRRFSTGKTCSNSHGEEQDGHHEKTVELHPPPFFFCLGGSPLGREW